MKDIYDCIVCLDILSVMMFYHGFKQSRFHTIPSFWQQV